VGYKYGDLKLQVEEISHETVKYGYGSSATWTSDCTVNYRPILSSQECPTTIIKHLSD
jgi:hypothetical protein